LSKLLNELAKFKAGNSKAYPRGKLMFLLSKMMRGGPEHNMDPATAEKVLRTRVEAMVPGYREAEAEAKR
jgi:aspartyl-tRNA(Asn)/glutamyl-tRNA(Gln) amidotransferase subunit B